ncbi:ABC transporter permease [Staphylococcus coagulans]|uniref:ABC transporter permease n=1 Tax=Staphylococcus coagulans TaxID=74706 RepID=UPI003364B42E
MHKFFATFQITYQKKLRSRSFITTTIIMILLIIGLANVDKIIKLFDGGEDRIAIVTQDKNLYQQVKKQYSIVNEETKFEYVSEKQAKQKLKKEDIDQAFIIDETKTHELNGTILSHDTPSDKDKSTLQSVLTQLQVQKVAQDLGLQGQDLQKLQAHSNVKSQIVQKEGQADQNLSSEEEGFSKTIVMAGTFLIFFITFNYAQQIAMEVATEKTSRVSEMIITSVNPVHHILAKILAILAVAFTQILALFITVVACYFIFDLKHTFDSISVEFTPHIVRLIIFGLLFLILCIFSYVILAAILGNLTSRIEDMAQSLMPMSLLIMGAFYSGYFGALNPDNLFIKITSYVPFFSPFVTFSRLSSSNVSTIEGIIAVIIHIVLIIVLFIIAAKTYKNSVLSFEKGWVNVLKRAFQRQNQS